MVQKSRRTLSSPNCYIQPSVVTPSFKRPSSSVQAQWQPLRRLRNGDENSFRLEAFSPAVPALMPLKHFDGLPAIRKWFSSSESTLAHSQLNGGYLSGFRNAIVPIEVTRATGLQRPEAVTKSFQRLEAPLGVFLDWTMNATKSSKERIYLAQASIQDLPQALRDDLPTPDLVTKAGKGDVYSTSIWLGIPPTYTPLHKDPNPNLFVQLAGQKVVRLLPPEVGLEVFSIVQEALGKTSPASFRGEEMMEGEEKKVLEDAVWGMPVDERLSSLSGQEAYLDQGDGLFIPKGWWHSIKGIGTGVTASVSGRFPFL